MICPDNYIKKSGYTTKNGTKVKSTCIKDLGLKGKGPKLFTLKKGTLLDYHYKNTNLSRHRQLLKSARKTGKTTVIRKLNAVKILTKRTNPKASKVFSKDIFYLQNKKI